MHWYQVKKSKAKSPPPKRHFGRSGHYPVFYFRLRQQPGQNPPRPHGPSFLSPTLAWLVGVAGGSGGSGTRLSAVSLPSSLRARKLGRRLVDRFGVGTGGTQFHSRFRLVHTESAQKLGFIHPGSPTKGKMGRDRVELDHQASHLEVRGNRVQIGAGSVAALGTLAG
jgi:hypothetical protein